jgi:DNA invertase Pin-like site-specific DNA recombinase
MSRTRRLAVSYSRFSDPSQAKGDSENRQEQMFREFCQRHNLTPSGEVFADRGCSGYTDEHRKKGRLGHLIGAAKDGRFEQGTVIVVEAWDRLGRLRPDKMTALVAELVHTGVAIGVCRLNDIFTEEDFGTHKWTTLAVFIQLAYQESKQKADRVADSWARRRQRARESGALLGCHLPAWLEEVNGEARLIPERAAVVRQIFRLAAQGYGQTRIIRWLVAGKVPPFGHVCVTPGRSRSQFAGKWTKPYVRLILNDRRAVGEFRPLGRDGNPDGAPLVGYYPAAVTEEEFLLARAGQEARLNKDVRGRTVRAREVRYVNVFKSMLRHARDGEGFLLHNKGTAARPELLLINASGNGGRGKGWTFPYPLFEDAILTFLKEVSPADVLPKGHESPGTAEVLRTKLNAIRQDVAGLQQDLKAGYSKALSAVLREKEIEEERVATQLQEELAKAVRPAERAWKDLPTLADLVKKGGDETRLRLRPVLRRVVEEILVLIVRRGSFQLLAAQVFFEGGARRDYLLVYQTAANRRPGGWWRESFREAEGLDLHKPAHVRQLERVLLGADLDRFTLRPLPR